MSPALKQDDPDKPAPFVVWHPERSYGTDHEMIWGSIFLLGFLVARFVPRQYLSWYPCVFRRITGIPCPTCGMTRATLYSAHLDFGSAFALNPLGTVALLMAALYALYAGVALVGRLPRLRPNCRHPLVRRAIRQGLPLLLLFNWIYMIIHGT